MNRRELLQTTTAFGLVGAIPTEGSRSADVSLCALGLQDANSGRIRT